MSARRLWLLIKYLPHTSQFIRAAAPDLARLAEWGPTEHLLAHLWDVIVAVNSDGKKDAPRFPRPSDQIEKEKRDDARRAALIDKYMARHKGQAEGTAHG